MSRFCCSLALVSVFVFGCGGEDDGEEADTDIELSDDQEFNPPALDESGVYFRVELTPDGSGGASISEVQRIVVDEGVGRPAAPGGGDWLLVARAGEEAQDASLVTFVTSSEIESEFGEFAVSERLEHEPAPFVAFVEDDGADRIELLAADGSLADAIEASEVPPLGFRASNMLPGRLSQIALLEPGEQDKLPSAFVAQGYLSEIHSPTVDERNKIIAILESLAPAARKGLSKIALARFVNKGCVAASSACTPEGTTYISANCRDPGVPAQDPDGFEINTAQRQAAASGSSLILNIEADWEGSLRHEVTHVANNLLDAQTAVPEWGWSDLDILAAERTLESNALGDSLSQTWLELHNLSVENAGVATFRPFPSVDSEDPAWCAVSQIDALQRAHVKGYGTKSVAEDIATYVEEVMSKGGEAAICGQFAQASNNELTPELALPYTKLVLLTSLEFITKAKFDACMQGFDPSRKGEGIQLGDQTFRSDLKYGFYESRYGGRYFGVLGRGVEKWGLLYDVRVPEGRSPVGLHRLGRINLFRIAPANGVYLDHPETPRASASGLLLITEANNDRVAGAVFNLQLVNAIGQKTTYYDYAPFLVGQPK